MVVVGLGVGGIYVWRRREEETSDMLAGRISRDGLGVEDTVWPGLGDGNLDWGLGLELGWAGLALEFRVGSYKPALRQPA